MFTLTCIQGNSLDGYTWWHKSFKLDFKEIFSFFNAMEVKPSNHVILLFPNESWQQDEKEDSSQREETGLLRFQTHR